jgi:hypothetical protein
MRNLFISSLLLIISVFNLSAQSYSAELQKLEYSVKKNLVENILPFWTGTMIDTII